MGNVRPFAYASQASRAAIAIALAAAATQAHAQGFAAGTPTVTHGAATITDSGNTTTVDVGTSVTTTIKWVPTDGNFGGGAIGFLPGGNTVTFRGTGSGPQTILNRVLPADTSRPIQLDGTINIDTQANLDTRVWIYSPGGILVGGGAHIDVGGLVLTAADPVTDQNGDFLANPNKFTLTAASGSTAPITIAPGAQINVNGTGSSNYLVVFAPQIGQEGAINVNGTTALVAGESATFTFNSGLFKIEMATGTSVTGTALSQSGTILGSINGTSGQSRIYLMSVPKNNAVTSVLTAGGSMGFNLANSATVDQGAIVLSAGSSIGSENQNNEPTFTRLVPASATLSAPTLDSRVISGAPITLAGDVTANQNFSVIDANAGIDTAGHSLTVNGNLLINANGSSGLGGTALLLATGGSVTVAGFTTVSADANFDDVPLPAQPAQGGSASVIASAGGTMLLNGLFVSAQAQGKAGGLGGTLFGGAAAVGGTAILRATGTGSHITSTSAVSVQAAGTGGNDQSSGYGGNGTGGTATINADAGGRVSFGASAAIAADARGFGGDRAASAQFPANGGNGTGGTATMGATGGIIEMADANAVQITADGYGGNSLTGSGGNGGTATGGTALMQATGAGQINFTNPSSNGAAVTVSADATAGSATRAGSDATGGHASIATSGTASINASQVSGVSVEAIAYASASSGAGYVGGNAVGGVAQVTLSGGTIAIDPSSNGFAVMADAHGGDSSTTAGTGMGGTAQISLGAGSTFTNTTSTSMNASASGGFNSELGQNAASNGGTVLIQNAGTMRLDTLQFNSLAIEVGGDTKMGDALISSTPGAITNLGSAQDGAAGDIVIRDSISTERGFGHLRISAGGNVVISGEGAISDSHDNATLDLIADNTGAGAGTVTLQDDAVGLFGTGATTNIYYNPTIFGSATDFSQKVSHQSYTGYQLINSAGQLQQVNGFLDQNFALSKNMDATGSAFTPIGNSTTPYTGKFDGLGHQISGLVLSLPGSDNVGLFGVVGDNAAIANVGIVNAVISGRFNVGGLIGSISSLSGGPITISNVYVTGSTINARSNVGGLIGVSPQPTMPATIVVQDSHADITINASGGNIGGLIGYFDIGTINRSFATGTISGTNSSAVGGLIGVNYGTVTDAYATTAITATGAVGGNFIGGLIGNNGGDLNRVYASGAITVGAAYEQIGGLVGYHSAGTISEGLASGSISAPTGATGGLIGLNDGTIQNSYWDTSTTGQASAVGQAGQGSASNVNSVDSGTAYSSSLGSYGNLSLGNWLFAGNATRPIGAWEMPSAGFGVADVFSAHQVQLITANPSGNYRLTQNIDMSGTVNPSDVWNVRAFQPIGIFGVSALGGAAVGGSGRFTGTLDGQGHSLINLTVNDTLGAGAALIGNNAGTIRDIGLYNANISSPNGSFVGALTWINYGSISGVYATGTLVGGQGAVGGLVGLNDTTGTITNSYTSMAVGGSAGSSFTGGLVGDNAGTITFTYASGSSTNGFYVGGLVGRNEASGVVSNSYWNSDMAPGSGCGFAVNGGCSVTGLTNAQMVQSSSYSGWSMANSGGQGQTWRIYDGFTAPLLTSFLRSATVQVSDGGSVVYNGAVQGVPLTIIGAIDSRVYGTPTFTGNGRNVGTYSNISYTGGLFSDQLGYDIGVAQGTGTLTITPAPLTLAAVADSKTYNASTTASSPQVQAQAIGLVGGDSISNLTQVFDSANAGSRTTSVANGYTINDGNGGANYTVNTATAAGTISQAALTLAAVADGKTYDATTTSAARVQVIGLQGSNDHVDGLVQTYDSANAGNRTLSVSNGYTVVDGNGGGNYIVSTADAAGVISKATLTLTASGDSKLYDTTTASTGTVRYAGLKGSDTITGLSQAFDSANAGTRSLVVGGGYTISDGNGGGNYAVALVNGAGTITPASLTVTYTANSGSSIYGNVPTGLSGSVSAVGLRGGDTLASQTSGAAAFTTSATGASSVGRYAINGSGLSGSTGNYQISFVQAAGNATALSITARAITATANAITRGEGAANPALTYALAGPTPGAAALVNGDQLTGALATTATTSSPIGSYAITQGTLAANSNYSLTYVGNTLTIASASSPQQIVQSIPQAAQTIAAVAPNVTAQADATPQVTPTADQQKEEEKAVAQAAKPAAVRTVLINDGTAAIPVPVDEDVTSNGSSGLWTPR